MQSAATSVVGDEDSQTESESGSGSDSEMDTGSVSTLSVSGWQASAQGTLPPQPAQMVATALQSLAVDERLVAAGALLDLARAGRSASPRLLCAGGYAPRGAVQTRYNGRH